MKNLIFIIAIFLIPLATVAQTEATQVKKNSVTGSVFLSGDSGFALDYRRTIKKNQQIVFGIQDAGFGTPDFVFGYRANLKQERKFSYSLGLDLLLRKRNVIGDNLLSQTIELVPKPQFSTLRLVVGMYYRINDRLDLMTELHVKTLLAIFSQKATNTLNLGLKYDF